MKINILPNSNRHNIIELLSSENNNIGVELGVAKGIFSSRMVSSGRFSHFFGVDMYADIHDTEEYKIALKKIGLFSNYKLLRMTFDEAFELFDDESLDFIYIDGYAHNGEEGGQTIFDWSRKVKVGGLIAGDDYHDDWPLVKEAVNEFIEASGFDLQLTSEIEENDYSNYPSWGTIKKHSTDGLIPSDALLLKGKRAKRPKRTFISYIKWFLVRYFSKDTILFLKSVKSKFNN